MKAQKRARLLFKEESGYQGLAKYVFNDDEMWPLPASLSQLPKSPTKLEDDRA